MNSLFQHIPKRECGRSEGPAEAGRYHVPECLGVNNIIQKEYWPNDGFQSLLSYFTSCVSLGKCHPLSGYVSSFIKKRGLDKQILRTVLALWISGDLTQFHAGLPANRFVTYRENQLSPKWKDIMCLKVMNQNITHACLVYIQLQSFSAENQGKIC